MKRIQGERVDDFDLEQSLTSEKWYKHWHLEICKLNLSGPVPFQFFFFLLLQQVDLFEHYATAAVERTTCSGWRRDLLPSWLAVADLTGRFRFMLYHLFLLLLLFLFVCFYMRLFRISITFRLCSYSLFIILFYFFKEIEKGDRN